MNIEGGCLCGAVRYSGEAEPAFAGVCHCRDCQKFTGSAFGAMVGVPQTSVKFEGALKTFTSLGGSGKPISRHFCPECGSSISEETVNLPGHVVINVGTLDDPAQMTPLMEIFCDDALSWVQLGGNPQRFAKLPS
jgi:hypothetical protein